MHNSNKQFCCSAYYVIISSSSSNSHFIFRSSQQLGSLLLSVNINSTSRSVSNLSSPINMTFPVTELQVSFDSHSQLKQHNTHSYIYVCILHTVYSALMIITIVISTLISHAILHVFPISCTLYMLYRNNMYVMYVDPIPFTA